MGENEKIGGSGIKVTLEKVEHEILVINKELSDNSLLILSLKNESSKLQNMFNTRF